MATRRGGIAVLWDFVHGVRKGAASALAQLSAPTGEAGFARLMGYRGPYSGNNTQPWQRAEQIRNFRHWVYRCTTFISEQATRTPPRVAYVTEPGAAADYLARQKAARLGRAAPPPFRPLLPPADKRSSHATKAYYGALAPHEDFEYADPGDRLGELLRNPNGPDTWVNFWQAGFVFDSLCGVNYTWVVDGADRKPESLWQVPAHWCYPVCLGRENLIDYYEVKPWGGSGQVLTTFSPEELIECKRFDPWNPLGAASPLQQNSETVDQYQQVQSYRYYSSLNRMSAETVIEWSGAGSEPVSNELLDRLESQIAAKYQGVQNALRPVILPPGLTLSRNPSDMELAFQGSSDQLRDYVISQVYGLPRSILGIGDGVPWATVVAMTRQVYSDVLGPLLSRFGAVYTEKLARRLDPRARIFWELPRPQDDAQKLAEWTGTPGPAVSVNEYRAEILALEPLEGDQYDQPMQPAGMLPGGGDDDLAGLFDRGPGENPGDQDGGTQDTPADAAKGDFRESDHPRASDGRFGSKPGTGGKPADKPGKKPPPKKPAAKPAAGKPKPKPGGKPKPAPEPEGPSEFATPQAWALARKRAAAQIESAPVPGPEQVKKVRAKLDEWKAACKVARANGEVPPKLREYYDARGGTDAHRKRAKRLFEAHGGDKRGYVVCHGTGRKMHWTDDPEFNPNGYPKFEQGKIFVAVQGGGYQDANVLPEHPSYNRLRGNAMLRPENAPGEVSARAGDTPATKIAAEPTDAQKATAARWVKASPGVSPEAGAKYAEDMAVALAALPPGAAAAAAKSMAGASSPKGPVGVARFHPDTKELRAEAVKITGKKSAGAGVVGFAHDRAQYTDLHLDGGPDPRGTYVHELWHAADNGRAFSDDAGWQSAYRQEVLKGKHLLSRYAMESPAEGFAEFGRVLAERGEQHMGEKFPKCVAYLKAKGLL